MLFYKHRGGMKVGNEEVNIQNETVVDNENHSKNDNKKKGSKTLIIIIILLIVVIALIGIGVYFLSSTKVLPVEVNSFV